MLNKDEVKEILLNWPDYRWEVQGFGMLRTYIEDGDGEPRLQIWDQRLAQFGNGAIHDHPWNFTSRIIAGLLYNQRFERDNNQLIADKSAHPGAKLFKEVLITPGKDGGAQDEEPFDTWLVPLQIEAYSAGEEYEMAWHELHVTRYLNGTVTMIERQRTRSHDTASSLSSGSVPWIFFRPRIATPEECEAVIGDCLKEWWL